MMESKGIGGGRPFTQADEAVIRSGPLVAERVGIALRDVFKEGRSPSVFVGDGIDDVTMLDPDIRLKTNVLVTTFVSTSVTVIATDCLLTAAVPPSHSPRQAKVLLKAPPSFCSSANVTIETIVIATVDQPEGAAVGIDTGDSVLTWPSPGGSPHKTVVSPPPQPVASVEAEADEVPTQVTPSRGWKPQLPGADSVHFGTAAVSLDVRALVRIWLRGGMIQGKSGEPQLGTDEVFTEHVM